MISRHQRGKASEGGASEGSCFFSGEQLAVHQSPRGNRRSGNVILEYNVDFDLILHYNPIENVETLH